MIGPPLPNPALLPPPLEVTRQPPVSALLDRQATIVLFQPSFSRVDWRLFDPETVSWEFYGEKYLETLKGMKPAQAS